MAKNNPYVRRLPLKFWKVVEQDGLASLVLFGYQVWWGVLFSWQWWLSHSMRVPIRIGMGWVGHAHFPIWLYKGHLWLTCHEAKATHVRIKGAATKPRYEAKEQWWCAFADPGIHADIEHIERALLGLKKRHDVAWVFLERSTRQATSRKATGIDVRDNRHIPQWVKIHVVLRDEGRCVYCGCADIKQLEFDHRKAWSKGGSSKDPLNICLGCKPCNRKKSDKDWGWS
jgi:hypothetical protein